MTEHRSASNTPRAGRLGTRAALALAVVLTSLWLAGLFRYTSFGIDRNQRDGERSLVTFYRARWPGDGSLWLGATTQPVPARSLPDAPLDLGGTFFGPAFEPQPRSTWNRLGFWRVHGLEDDPFAARFPQTSSSSWIAVPGWLPAVLLGVWPLWRRRIRGESARSRASQAELERAA